jgi:hypothetical protein
MPGHSVTINIQSRRAESCFANVSQPITGPWPMPPGRRPAASVQLPVVSHYQTERVRHIAGIHTHRPLAAAHYIGRMSGPGAQSTIPSNVESRRESQTAGPTCTQ